MSNIFNQVNLRVKEHKYMRSSTNPDTSMMQLYESMCLAKEDEARIKGVEAKMENERKQEVQANIAAGQMLESFLLNLGNRLYTEGKEMLFTDIMCDIYLESVYLDDDFKMENDEQIRSVMADYISKNGGFAMLEAACKKEGTKLLKDMKEIVETTARKCSLRKAKELNEACSSKNRGAKAMEVMNGEHHFDMNDDEMRDYQRSREKLSEDEIVKFVKDKVLDVIKDEKAHQEDLERFEAEIAERAAAISGDETKQNAFKESAMGMVRQNTYADMTLFEAIQFSTMKELMEATRHSGNEYSSLEDYIEDNDEDSFDDDNDLLGDDEVMENATIDMDMVLAESITKYTLLEVCHSMKLEKFTRESVQNLSLNLSK